MVHLKKLVLKGFKSFPKETEIPLENSMNVIVGPNGSGKCLTGDSLIQLADGSLERIGNLVNSRIDKAVKTEDGFLIAGDGTEIICFDTATLKTVNKLIKSFVKRTSPEKILKIKTRSGKEIKTTKYHPLFTLKNSEVIALKAEELKKGVRIAIPRKINFKPENNYFIELLNLVEESDKIYIPYKEEFKLILNSIKGNFTWQELAEKIGVSYYVLKGLLDKQAINLHNLIKILRYSNLSDKEIIGLIREISSMGTRIIFPFENSQKFSRFFGYLLAEGRLAESSQIWFTNGDKEIVEDYISLVKKLFNKTPLVREYKPNCWDVIIFSEPLKKILSKLGMASKTEKKEISNILLKHSSNMEISSLLNGLYCGDGYVSKSSIEITTKSEKLAKGIETCLLRLGIVCSKKKQIKGIKSSGFFGEYFNIIIYGTENFFKFKESISLIHNKKREKILQNLFKKSNPNTDLIESNDLIRNIVAEQEINVKESRIKFPRLDSYCYNQCTPSRTGLILLRRELLTKNSASAFILDKLICSDIFWDEVVEIQEIAGEEWVYDLCVEKEHNFIANNIFVHNSNITDAICFVLGRMSIKSMRAAKSANLLFAGTKQHKASSEASVKLILDNTDKKFSLPDKEITLERTVRQTGQSIYKINNHTKTRQEILELLAQAGIDPYGFNIILQGEINSIIKMHPEERRKVIEQVAGIFIYEVRKERSLKELEKTEEKLKEVSTTLRERASYLKNLEEERRQALRYKKLKHDAEICKASIIKRKLNEKEKNLVDIKSKQQIQEQDKSKFRKKEQELRNKMQNFEEQIKNINIRIQQSSGVEQEQLNREISDLRAELAGLNVRKENTEEKLQETLSKREKAKNEIEKIEEEIKKLKKESPSQTKKQKQLEEKKAELEEIEKERKKLYNTREKLNSIKEKIKDYEERAQKNKNEYSFIINEANNLAQKLTYKEAKTCKQALEKLRHDGLLDKAKLEKLDNKIREYEKIISALTSQISDTETIKKQVDKLDICPLCKSKITEKHIKHVFSDCDEKISSLSKELNEKIKFLETSARDAENLKSNVKIIQEKISKAEIDLIKLDNIEEKKEQIKKLSSEKENLQEQILNLNKEKEILSRRNLEFKDIEEKYDKTLLQIQEISARSEENLDAELDFKLREIENLKLARKTSIREEEELKEDLSEIEKEIQDKEDILDENTEKERILEKKFQKLVEKRTNFEEQVHNSNSSLLKIQHEISIKENEINNFKIEIARLDAERENLALDFEPYKGMKIINLPVHILQEKLEKTQQILDSIGSVNLKALEVYDKIKNDYDAIAEKVNVLIKEKGEILKIAEEIDRKKTKTFMKTLNAVNELFNRNFIQLSDKGEVFLEPENREDIFSAGLDVVVRVGKGKYFDVTSLSGGEQAIVALSLIFAIQEYKPYCFYIFDEVDAALDKRNSEKLASLIKKYMKTGQYVIVTHNDAIITESSLLYGVSMQEGISKILSLEV